jgi:putative transcriptional regulator
MKKQHQSEAYAAIHETMKALHEVGAIDKQTMREFDETCLIPALPMLDEKKIKKCAKNTLTKTRSEY